MVDGTSIGIGIGIGSINEITMSNAFDYVIENNITVEKYR